MSKWNTVNPKYILCGVLIKHHITYIIFFFYTTDIYLRNNMWCSLVSVECWDCSLQQYKFLWHRHIIWIDCNTPTCEKGQAYESFPVYSTFTITTNLPIQPLIMTKKHCKNKHAILMHLPNTYQCTDNLQSGSSEFYCTNVFLGW